MNGPEHYREAERRLLMAWEDDRAPENVTHLVAEAQVHATLALVAATALAQPIEGHAAPGISQDEYDEWYDAIEIGHHTCPDGEPCPAHDKWVGGAR